MSEDEVMKMPESTMGNVPVEITVVLGTATMTYSELGELTSESLIELNEGYGELLDIRVGELTVARGEIVVMGDQLGMKIVEVCDVDG
jgi:flagellar motor switch protein FliN/FliY